MRSTSVAASFAAVRAAMLAPLVASLLAMSAVAVPSASLQAQDPDGARQTVTGTVRDAGGFPVANAEVYISQRETPVRTDVNGVFRIPEVRWGDYWLYVRRMGYAPSRQTITVQYQKEPRPVEFLMEMLPVTLSEVEVTAESGFGGGIGSAPWFTRDVKAWGRLITRDRIAASRAPSVTLLLRQYINNFPYDLQQAHRALAEQRGSVDPGQNFGMPDRFRQVCVPAISVNAGFPQVGLDVDAIAVDDVEAIEFFRANVGTPLALQYQIPQGSCGLVRLWVKPYVDVASGQGEGRQ